MKPIKFNGCNCVYAEDQEEYLNLPVHKYNDEQGTVVACWGLNLLERMRVLFTGRVYLSLLTFGKPLSPHLLETEKPAMDIEGA